MSAPAGTTSASSSCRRAAGGGDARVTAEASAPGKPAAVEAARTAGATLAGRGSTRRPAAVSVERRRRSANEDLAVGESVSRPPPSPTTRARRCRAASTAGEAGAGSGVRSRSRGVIAGHPPMGRRRAPAGRWPARSRWRRTATCRRRPRAGSRSRRVAMRHLARRDRPRRHLAHRDASLARALRARRASRRPSTTPSRPPASRPVPARSRPARARRAQRRIRGRREDVRRSWRRLWATGLVASMLRRIPGFRPRPTSPKQGIRRRAPSRDARSRISVYRRGLRDSTVQRIGR